MKSSINAKRQKSLLEEKKDLLFKMMMERAMYSTPFGRRLQDMCGQYWCNWPLALRIILRKRRRKRAEIEEAVRIMIPMTFQLHQMEILFALNIIWKNGKPVMTNKLRPRNIKSMKDTVVNIKDVYDFVLKEHQ